MRIEIADVEVTIRREVEGGATQRTVAQTYALGLRSSADTDWAAVNQIIIKRWSESALVRIKNMAHSGKCFQTR